ncbi:MAG: Abi family protein, partial [Chlorobium sp.]|nr:Abi family protein [Chlorobium sp.]
FKPNASFNNAFKLYCFDRELRQLVLGEAFGPTRYADKQRFTNHRYGHDRTLQKLLDDFRNSQEEFIVAFRKKYSDNYPPCSAGASAPV